MIRRRAFVVVDLGFGDCGKGLITDWLVRRWSAPLVVRFNGGAQAGHNVVTADGRHHTFSQIGAGTFAGARTFLSRHVVVHPTALLVEAGVLERSGVARPLDGIEISSRARVVTPLHQAMNRLRELARGAGRHGSCGVGVGEVVADSLAPGAESVLAGDLSDPSRLRQKLAQLRERKRVELAALPLEPTPEVAAERALFDDDAIDLRWLEQASRLAGRVRDDEALATQLRAHESVVFEGAQGMLLDEQHGFHPFTTWSDCSPANAVALVQECGAELELHRIGVLRSHVVRHGPGPLPTESGELRGAIVEHNRENPWQGPVRYGWFDAALARYALKAAGPLEAIALTHLDAPPRLGTFRFAGPRERPESPPPSLSSGPADARSVVSCVERLLERTIALTSAGPTASDVATTS